VVSFVFIACFFVAFFCVCSLFFVCVKIGLCVFCVCNWFYVCVMFCVLFCVCRSFCVCSCFPYSVTRYICVYDFAVRHSTFVSGQLVTCLM